MKRLFYILFTVVIVLNAGILLAFMLPSVKSSPTSFAALKSGDIILRNGKGIISNWFREMSLKDKRFSHAGLIVKEHDQVFVVHAYQDANPSGLIKETINEFINPELCDKYAVYRLDLNDHQRENVISEISSDLKKNIPFDKDFEMNNGTALYCTEWVRSCINNSVNDTNYIPFSALNDFRFVSPDNLYLNQHTKQLLEKDY